MTTITLTDPALVEQLRAAGIVEFRDPDGRVLGNFTVVDFGALPPGVVSPFTDEELAERRKVRTGRPLADILKDLEKLA